MADDGYGAWYANRLWGFIPAIYRTLDAEAPGGALRELVERIGEEAARLRRSIDRLGEDAFIETCDDWAIPYIGALLATRVAACMDPRAQRLDVANTIYYRRREGTVGLLEELASNVAGRDARVVEFFRRMGRTRHQWDPPIGDVSHDPFVNPEDAPGAVIEGLAGAFTRSQAGGFADLRNVHGALSAHGPFDEFSHTADFRRGGQSVGWHNIPRLGVFVWWLHAYPVLEATPVERSGCPGQFTFDPSGREIPLFAASERAREQFGEHWVTPDEWELPAPVRNTLWDERPDRLYPDAFSVDLGGGIAPVPAALSTLDIDPEAGRFRFIGPKPLGVITTRYHFGFSAPVGAGGFDGRILSQIELPAAVREVPSAMTLPNALAGIAADATVRITGSATYAGPTAALAAPPNGKLAIVAGDRTRPVLRWTAPGAWTISGGGTDGSELVLQGLWLQGADVVLTGVFSRVTLRMVTLDPGSSGAGDDPPTLFGTAIDGVALAPTRLFIEADIGELVLERCITGPIRTRAGGSVETLQISDSIVQSIPTRKAGVLASPVFDPYQLAAQLKASTDPLAVSIRAALTASVQTVLDAYVPGNAPTAALRNGILAALGGFDPDKLAALFPLALADVALGLATGTVKLVRSTVLGPTRTHRLTASESILDEVALVEDPQHGCVRFSVFAQGSNLHAPYRCLRIPAAAPIFRTRVFGRPDYARQRRDPDGLVIGRKPEESILTRAENGSEPGAFSTERISLDRRGLALKFLEFMPIGLTPVWIDAD